MYSSFDYRQTRSLVEYRRQQVASDAARRRVANQPGRRRSRLARVRVAVGAGLIRAGVRIAGTYLADLPHLRPGV